MKRLVGKLHYLKLSDHPKEGVRAVIGMVENHGIQEEECRMLDISMQCWFPSPGRYSLDLEISIEFEGGKIWEAKARIEPEVTVHGPQSFRPATRIQQFHATAKKNGVVWMPVRSTESAEELSSDQSHHIAAPEWLPRRVIIENWRNRPAVFKKGAEHVFVGASSWADVATIEQALEMVAEGGHIWLLHGEHPSPSSVGKSVTIQGAEGQAEPVTISAAQGSPTIIEASGVQFKDVTLREAGNGGEPMFKIVGKGSISATDCLFAKGKEIATMDPRPDAERMPESVWAIGFALLALIFLVGWLWALQRPLEPVVVTRIDKVVREFYAPENGNIVAWAPRRANENGGHGVRLANVYANHWSVDVFDFSVCQLNSLPGIRVEETIPPYPRPPSEPIEIWIRSDAEESSGRFKAPTEESGWTQIPFSTDLPK